MDNSYTSFDGSVALDSAVLSGATALQGTSAAESIYVSAYGAPTTTAVQGLVIDDGGGSDSLYVSSDARGEESIAVGVDSSDIVTGAAADNINISASASSETWGTLATTATAVALQDSSLSSGDGADSVHLSAWAQGATTLAIAAEDSTIDTGAGDDYLSLSANTSENAYLDPAYGAVNTDIDLGEGNDSMWINSSANGGDASVLDAAGLLSTDPDYYNLVDAGSGDDQLSVYTNAWAQAGEGSSISTATGIEGYEVLLGDGADSLTVSATAQGDVAIAYGTFDAIVDSGDAPLGSETVWVNSSSPGGSWWYDSLGGDRVQIGANANGDDAYAVGAGSTEIVTGSGDDNINISASASSETWGTLATTATAVALQDSSLSSGDGADSVHLSAWAQGATTLAIAAEDSTIDTGAGDDNLSLWAETREIAYLDPAFGAVNTDIVLGEGNDLLFIGAPPSAVTKPLWKPPDSPAQQSAPVLATIR